MARSANGGFHLLADENSSAASLASLALLGAIFLSVEWPAATMVVIRRMIGLYHARSLFRAVDGWWA